MWVEQNKTISQEYLFDGKFMALVQKWTFKCLMLLNWKKQVEKRAVFLHPTSGSILASFH